MKKRHILRRAPLADSIFVSQVGLPASDCDLVLAVRRAIAGFAGVAPDLIYPDDILEDIGDLALGGWDDLGFLIALRAHAGIVIDRAKVRMPRLQQRMLLWYTVHPGVEVREWITHAVPELRKGIRTWAEE
jgi:hypothetical protein